MALVCGLDPTPARQHGSGCCGASSAWQGSSLPLVLGRGEFTPSWSELGIVRAQNWFSASCPGRPLCGLSTWRDESEGDVGDQRTQQTS